MNDLVCEDCGKAVSLDRYAKIQKTLKTDYGDRYVKVKNVCPNCLLKNRGWRVLAYGVFRNYE